MKALSPSHQDLPREPRSGLGPKVMATVVLVCWLYLSALAWLGAWLLGAKLAVGWAPHVVVSQTMAPSLARGDVVIEQPTRGHRPAVGDVILYRRPTGSLVSSRVVGIAPPSAVLVQGDAQPASARALVPDRDIMGVGRLVVPLIGLPLAWLDVGNYAPFAGWLLASLASLALLARRAVTRRRARRQAAGGAKQVPVRLYDGSVKAVGSALWKLRLLAGGFVLAELYAHRELLSPSSDATGLRVSFWPAITATLAILAVATATSLVALRAESGKLRSALGAAELVIDAMSVLALATILSVFGSTVTWALLIVPVLEGALRFRMRGAVLAWLALAALYPAVYLWQQPRSVGPILLSLQTVSNRLGVVLLVAVPSGFLSDHLLAEIQALAWSQAKSTERARVLAVVAGSAAKVVSLGGNVFQAAVEGLVNMGFTTAGIVDRQGRVLFKAGDMAVPVAVPSSSVGLPAGPDPSHSGAPPPRARPEQPLPRPVVLVDASAGPEEATALRQAGVAAVVYVPLEPDGLVLVGTTQLGPPSASQVEGLGLLAAQTGVAIRNRQLHEQLKQAHTRVEHQALHDPLTGLPNRLSFHQELEEALSAEPSSVGLLYCDLDSFKPVNDAYGHEVGDGLLVAVAERLQGCVGRQDQVFRLGGDELTVLLRSELAAQVAPAVAGRICQALSQPFEVSERVLRVSVSVGLALGSPGERADDLVNKADMAMYAAKMNGRGHWEAWRKELVAAGATAHGH